MADKDDYGRADRPATPDLSSVHVDQVSLPTGVLDKKTGANVMTVEKVKEAGVITAIAGYLITAGAAAAVLQPGMLGMMAIGAGAAVSAAIVPMLAVGVAIGTIGAGIALAAKGIEMFRNRNKHEPAAPSHAPAHKAAV